MVIKNNQTDVEILQDDLNKYIQQITEQYHAIIDAKKQEIATIMEPMVHTIGHLEDTVATINNQMIRNKSYTGSNYELKTLSSGDDGDGDFIIWQKLRYLDEELPKLIIGAKDINFNHFASFENLMAQYSSIRDFFIPTDRGCVAFQLSRSSQRSYYREQFMVSPTNPFRPWVEYVRERYNLEHWNELSIFVKNGQNLYVIYLNGDDITIESDNLFLSPNSFDKLVQINPISPFETNKSGDAMLDNLEQIKKDYEKRRQTYLKLNHRVYIMDILQGLLDRELFGKNKTVVFNNADGNITYEKWTKQDILEILAPNDDYGKKGDPIIVPHPLSGKDRGNSSVALASVDAGIHKLNKVVYTHKYHFSQPLQERMVIRDESGNIRIKDLWRRCSFMYRENGVTTHRYSLSEELLQKKGVLVKFCIALDTTSPKAPEVKSVIDEVEITSKDLYYRHIHSYYNPHLYRNPETSLDFIKKHYPCLFQKGNKYYYITETNKILLEAKNRGYEDLINTETLTIDYELVKHYYVGGKQRWTDSSKTYNIYTYRDEMLPLKNVTQEIINYMIMKNWSIYGEDWLEIKQWFDQQKKEKNNEEKI